MKHLIPHLFLAAALLVGETAADSRYTSAGRQYIDGQCYYCAKSNSDPHIHTYDGKEYQCQGAGDYVLTKSKESSFEAQARFWVPPEGTTFTNGRNGATTTAAVLSTGVGNEKPIEMHVVPEGMNPIPGQGRLPGNDNDCTMEYIVDGHAMVFPDATADSNWQNQHIFTDAANGYTFDRYRQTLRSRFGVSYAHWREFDMIESGVKYKAQKRFDSTFGCYLDVYLCLPCDFGEEFHGLFGNPNGDINDDFEQRNGVPIKQKDIPTLGRETTYCAANWCVEDKATSLFETPSDYERCTSDVSDNLDDIVENADPTIKSQCKNNVNCILDTVITGNIETGLRNLEDDGNSNDKNVQQKVAENEQSDSYTCAKAGMEPKKAFGVSSDLFPHPINLSGDLPHSQLNSCFLESGFVQLGWSFLVSADGLPWEFPMYAGSNGCGDMGEVVGKLTVTYHENTRECEGSYESLDGYTLQEFQFFCGTTTFPSLPGTGSPTIATTLYGCNHLETETHTSDSCTISNVNKRTDRGGGIGGKRWVSVIAHAIACEQGPTSAPTDSPTPAPTPAPTPQIVMNRAPPKAPDSPSPEDRTTPIAFTKGDPHFKTFGGELYDYHGECDLVLLHNPNFKEGLGMDIHIRTKIDAFWSSVESAVLKLGTETLEIKADPDSDEWLWSNGKDISSNTKNKEWQLFEMSGFLVRYMQSSANVREANIYLKGSKEVLLLKTFKHFVRVDVAWEGSDNYEGSTGLLGSKAEGGKRLGRDGQFIEDTNAFGLEWQVRPEVDGSLFHSYEGAVVGKPCVMPPTYVEGDNLTTTALRGRRLGAGAVDTAAAEKACSHLVDAEDKKACVFDVIATQDLSMAGSW